MSSRIWFTLEKVCDNFYLTRDGETIRVSCLSPLDYGYKKWIENGEELGWMREDNNVISYLDKNLRLIKQEKKNEDLSF